VLTIYRERSSKLIVLAAAAFAFSILLDVWWVPQYFVDSQTSNFWIGVVSPWFLINFFVQYFEDPVAIVAFLGIGIFFLISVLKKRFKFNEGISLNLFLVMSWITLSYAIPLAYSLIKEPMLLARYTIVVLPGIIIFISLGIQSLLSAKYKFYLLSLVFISFMVCLLVQKKYYTSYHKAQWRDLSKIVLKDTTRNYIFYSSYDFYFNNYFYQLTKSTHRRCLYPTDDFENQIITTSGVWLLEAHNDGSKIPDKELKILEAKFTKTRVVELFQARGVLYTRGKKE